MKEIYKNLKDHDSDDKNGRPVEQSDPSKFRASHEQSWALSVFLKFKII